MIRYHWNQFLRELWYSITHPRRLDWFELRYAALSLWADIQYPFKQPFWFLATVWAYRDVLWRDRDWDYSRLLAMMERKLRRMSDHLAKHGHTVGSDRHAKQLKIAAELCKRIRLDAYEDPFMVKLDEKYGRLEMSSEPTNNPRLAELIIKRPRVNGDEARERAASQRIWKHAETQKKADIQMLGRLFDKHLLNWWD